MSVDNDECMRVLAEAGIKGKDAKTSMTVIGNRLSPYFFMPRLRRELERVYEDDDEQIQKCFQSLFGSDAGRAATVLAKRADS